MANPWLLTLHHDGSPRYLSHPCPRLGQTVRVRLRVGAAAPIQRVLLRASHAGTAALTPMAPAPGEPTARWFEADLRIAEPLTRYRFLLEAEDGTFWYTSAGASGFDPLDASDFCLMADQAPPEATCASGGNRPCGSQPPRPPAAPRPAASKPPRYRPRCPGCGRKKGVRLERHITTSRAPGNERWACLWCGATWTRADRSLD